MATEDPIPPGGLVEHVYATLYARTDRWEPVFLTMLRKAYGSDVVPERFRAAAMRVRLEDARDRETERGLAECECGCRG